jgi:hypothetical protein
MFPVIDLKSKQVCNEFQGLGSGLHGISPQKRKGHKELASEVVR